MAKRSAEAMITLHKDKPTTLTFKELNDWVIWQIPHPVGNGLCGAVKSSMPEHLWIPAIIDVKKEKVQVCMHTWTNCLKHQN